MSTFTWWNPHPQKEPFEAFGHWQVAGPRYQEISRGWRVVSSPFLLWMRFHRIFGLEVKVNQRVIHTAIADTFN